MTDLGHVPSELAHRRTLPGHVSGDLISPADLVAYLIGWNELVLTWLERDDRGSPVDFPETGFGWNQLGELAHKFYTDYADLGWDERLSRLGAARDALLDTVVARSDTELYGQPWYGKWTKGRMIQLNTSSPYKNARARIRKWLKEQP